MCGAQPESHTAGCEDTRDAAGLGMSGQEETEQGPNAVRWRGLNLQRTAGYSQAGQRLLGFPDLSTKSITSSLSLTTDCRTELTLRLASLLSGSWSSSSGNLPVLGCPCRGPQPV